tara:strand:- start:1853 stop:1984 length:132 start_codon:yes stop_codon:yes gene_type:complete
MCPRAGVCGKIGGKICGIAWKNLANKKPLFFRGSRESANSWNV